MPFVAAVLMAWLERSRLNDFATWRTIEARVTAVLPGREAANDKSREIA
jgi:hypothetical protein